MAWGEHWEWRAFFELPEEVRQAVEALPKKWGPAAAGQDVTDTYLWRPGIQVNAKLRVDPRRSAELKLKRFVRSSPDGSERWLEDPAETFGFPLTGAAWAAVLRAVGATDPRAMPPLDAEQLLARLSDLRPAMTAVSIRKRRLHYIDPADTVTIELARVFTPVEIDSVGLEVDFGPGADERELAALQRALGRLRLADSPHPESYLTFIERHVAARPASRATGEQPPTGGSSATGGQPPTGEQLPTGEQPPDAAQRRDGQGPSRSPTASP